MSPALHITRDLVKRGFEVVFMSSPEFKDAIERLGAEFYETSCFWPEGSRETHEKIPPGLPRMMWDLGNLFIGALPARSANIRSLLEMLHEREPSRDIIIVCEVMSMAILPFFYGAPLPKGFTKFHKVVNVNGAPVPVTSIDTAPFGPGLPPDSTESGRARNRFLYDMMSQGPFKALEELHLETLRKCGCTSEPRSTMFDTWMEVYDTTFQLCSPSLEYPGSDLHPTIRYAGCLPKKAIDPNFQYPAWWSDIKPDDTNLPVGSEERRKIVTVTQGTVQTDYNDLVIPTIKAFADRSDVIVVAILGVKGASLPADFNVPTNTRVVDFLPYDAALECTNVFVTNGGSGGLMHCVINGVPLVMAGITEEKIEVSARGEYAGLAINLRTQTPTIEEVFTAVDKVLTQPSYKARAMRLKLENEDLESLSIIEREIMKYAKAT